MDNLPVVLRAHPDNAECLFAGTIDGDLLAINLAAIAMNDDHNAGISVDTSDMDAPMIDPIGLQHEASCRALDNLSSNLLLSGAQDGTMAVIDHTVNKVAATFTLCNEDGDAVPVSTLSALTQHLFAVGDDDGIVKLYDMRSENPVVQRWEDHEDFVSGLLLMRHKLISVGGDGYLCVFDPRMNGKLFARSDQQDDGFTAVVPIYSHTNKPRLVCSTESGVLSVFNWGWWGDVKDRVVGHPENVGCLAVADDSSGQLITGSDDGLIRMIRVHPNEFTGVLAELKQPIESIALLADGQHIASCCHDTHIRIHSVTSSSIEESDQDSDKATDKNSQLINSDGSDDDSDDDSDDSTSRHKRQKLRKQKSIKKIRSYGQQKRRQRAAAFFGDLVDE